MAYTIFDNTMVDMTWQEVQKAGKENKTIILPISVIEEHGPHMDLAPDVYLVHKQSKDCKMELEKLEVESLIAPPFYWGINRCTGHFPGSFSVREETMIMLLTDIVSSLKSWGFSNVYILNSHGDYYHINTISRAAKQIRTELDINIQFVIDIEEVPIYNIDISEQHILAFKCEGTVEELYEYSFSDYADIHAGGAETSSMLKSFPNSVNSDILSDLVDSKVAFDKLHNWCDENAITLTPLGYCGNPSNINIEEIEKWNLIVTNAIAKVIKNNLDSL